ncbi:trans-aconitate 2-methyltransferase [Trichoderma arundinaceum]|uniref:Trans-aconitate 2-methyltransferase n=1 Tax=Trichoderma arundinaceum TaxID=490622 RepID=A0A395NQS1_TRIAR|nr:trans-aconitate 2-methyltransferase [Trichoderma arundinaceum]
MISRPLSKLSRTLLNRTMATQPTGQGRAANTKDWSAAQYLKFAEQRTRPSHDLLAQVPLASPKRIIDIGCGPGNSTEVLVKKWPDAQVRGMDSSPDMIETARKALPNLEFTVSDLHTYTPEGPVDLLFSNAVFQWINFEDRIPIIRRLLESLKPGGVFALQVPDNYTEGSHEAMRAVAENGPWSETLERLKPSLGPFQTPFELYNELKPLCSSIDIWHTYYQHPLGGHQEVVEWVKGTGLRPFIDPLNQEQKEGFLAAYLEKLKELYPLCNDGSVLLRYPRLFMVAVRS